MDKKRLLIICFIVLALLVLCICGFISMSSYQKKEDLSDAESPIMTDANDTMETQNYFSSYEEAIPIIRDQYAGGDSVYFDHEENGCWIFLDSAGYGYSYCDYESAIQPLGPMNSN